MSSSEYLMAIVLCLRKLEGFSELSMSIVDVNVNPKYVDVDVFHRPLLSHDYAVAWLVIQNQYRILFEPVGKNKRSLYSLCITRQYSFVCFWLSPIIGTISNNKLSFFFFRVVDVVF